MTPRPKTIQIFLPDGDPQSVRIAEITSRTVQAVQVPRGVIERAASRSELKQVGVYFLFGDADEGELPRVYVGEAEDCWVRLGQHHKDPSKDYWTQAVVVTSKTHKFDKGQGRWLEWFATGRAAGAGRYVVENQCAAKEPHLTEPVKADLLDHFDTLAILVATLGFPLFRPAAATTDSTAGVAVDLEDAPALYSCEGKGARAHGRMTAEGFVVLKGSVVRSVPVKSAASTSGGRARRRLEKEGVLALEDDTIRFTRDYLFRTPSGAADVVLGRNANGWIEWTSPDGRTLDETHRQTTN